MTNEDLLEYYQNTLILQYKRQVKAPQHIAALVNSEMVFELLDAIENGFNLDTGAGRQLDIVAKYLGIDRTITGIPIFDKNYFGFIKYGDYPAYSVFDPFIVYGDTVGDSNFLVYGESEDVLKLSDADFRKVLKFRVLQANAYHSLYELDTALFDSFGNDIYITDNEDMTIVYHFPTQDTRLSTILQSENLLPRPMGVSITISYY